MFLRMTPYRSLWYKLHTHPNACRPAHTKKSRYIYTLAYTHMHEQKKKSKLDTKFVEKIQDKGLKLYSPHQRTEGNSFNLH